MSVFQNSNQTRAKESSEGQENAWGYSIIKRPIITEKTYRLAQNNVYTFEVSDSTNKKQVKKAVEKIFNVVVTKVRIVNSEGKNVQFQYRTGKTRFVKKAFVTVADGYSISI